ncbi:MAG: sugar transferase [Acidimicrobiia bacterium]|nr:sugar transferase [Acidimicrobiia bacterium]
MIRRGRLAPLPDRRGPPKPHYRGKRVLDLTMVAIVAPPAAVLGACCALAIRLTGRGPVIFRQQRVGLQGQRFTLLKFRTMIDGDNPVFPDETRITWVGRILRRTSLDELPQLVNVARGQMSIVGPRPTLAYQVERYTDRQRGRLSVRPGVTGLAQVQGRNALRWAERIEFDLAYIETQSLRTDLSLIARSVRSAASGEGTDGHPEDDPLARSAEDAA